MRRDRAAHRHDFFDLDDADLAAGRGGLVEVARGLAEHEVAGLVGLPGLDEREVGEDAAFQDIFLPSKFFTSLPSATSVPTPVLV
jgi:hypothetical protein